jgi:4-hydroxy-4-methyl-2-oxoglutarate aldolase
MINWTKAQMEYFITEYKKLNTSLVYDALFIQYGYRNQIIRGEVKPIVRDMQVAGPVVTVKGSARYSEINEEFDKNGLSPLNGMWIRVEDAMIPHGIVLVDCGYHEVAVLGDIFAMTWKRAGMDGLVADGMVRDSFGFLEDDIPLFCTKTVPICAETRWGITDVNVPMWVHGQLGEVLVKPGDFIFGDADGVLVIPNEVIEKVLANAQERAANEIKAKEAIRREGLKARELFYGKDAAPHGGNLEE